MNPLTVYLFTVGIISVLSDPDQKHSDTPADTIYLEEIAVEGVRIYEPRSIQPLQVQQIDSTTIRMSGAVSLADLLERHSGAHVTNYGPAGINSISQRGMPSRHTQVIWNGINMNSETLGSCDLSIIPAAMISEVEITSSGSANHGSGAVGGQVRLNSNPNTGLQVAQTLGNIGQRISTVEAGSEWGDWTFFGRGLYENSDHEFEYADPFSDEMLTRENNDLEQFSLGGGVEGRLGTTEVESQVWWLDMYRGVPGQATAPTRQAYQEDQNLQWMTHVTQPLTEGVETGLTSYVKWQQLDYFNPSSDIESLTESRELRLRLPFNWNPVPQLDIRLAGETASVEVASNNFGDKKRRVHTGQLSATWQPAYRLRIYPAVRFDHYNDFGGAISASLGSNIELLDNALFFRAYASRDFNAPTFNDLYWPQVGNPDLEPETANRFETGFFYQVQGPVALRFDALIFTNRLEEGIEWRPVDGSWSPANVQQINARGAELESTVMTYFRGFGLHWTNRYSYTRSVYGAGHNHEGNQLRFMPRHHFTTRLNVKRNSLTISTGWFGVGRRYTSPENERFDSVDPYHEWDIAVAWERDFYGVTTNFRWNIQNILNRQHEVVPNYPLPGRHHMFTLSLSV